MHNIKMVYDEKIQQKINQAVTLAKRRAARKTSTTIKAAWARAIHQALNLSIDDIKKAIVVKPGHVPGMVRISVDSTTHAALGVKRSSKKRSLPLTVFNPRQTRQGVMVKIKRNSGKKMIYHAFKQGMVGGDPNSSNTQRRASGMGSSHKGVFIRAKYAHYRVKRLPIKEVRTTSLEDIAQDTAPEIEKMAVAKMADHYARQLAYELSQQFNNA